MNELFDLESEILRQRRRNLLNGQREIVILGDGRGSNPDVNLYDGIHRLRVRWPGSPNEQGTDSIGIPFSVLAGHTNYICEMNQQVYIRWHRDLHAYMIDGPDPVHMAATKRAMTLLNPHNPYNNFIRPDQWMGALSGPVGGMFINMQQWVVVLDDGTYIEYQGSSADSSAVSQHQDLSSYVPGTVDEHRYACLVFNVNQYKANAEPLQIVISTPKNIALDLTPADIVEALATRADLSCRAIWAYRLEYGQTELRRHKFDRDLRGIPAGPLTIPDDFIDGDMIQDEAITLDHLANNVLHIATADPTVDDDADAGYGVGSEWINTVSKTSFILTDTTNGAAAWKQTSNAADTMTSWNLLADAGAPESVADGDDVIFEGGDAIGTAVSAPRTVTISVLDGGIDADKLAALAVTDAKVNDVAIGKLTGLTTKGDIIARTTTGPVRQAVGLDYQPLIADSSASTGLSYGAPASDIAVTWGEGTVSANMAMYLRESDGKWYKASSNIAASPIRMSGVRGFVSDAGTGAINTTGKVRIAGPMAGFTGLTAGKPVWIDSTNGSYTTTAPSTVSSGIVALMGLALTSQIISVGPQNPVLYRTAAGGVAQGTVTTITHHSDSALRRTPKAREITYTDVVETSYASSNRDTDVSLSAAAGASVTIDSAGATTSFIGNSGGTIRRIAQAITPSTTARIISFTVRFAAKVGAPTGNMLWRLETDNADKPSGTLVAVGASGSFTPTDNADNTITITGFPVTTSGTKVWFVLQTSVSQSSGNYWQFTFNTSNVYAGGSLKSDTEAAGVYPGTWATGGTGDLRSSFITAVTIQLAQSYTASSTELVTRARLWMKKTGSPTYDLRVGFYTDSGGVPGTVIGSSGRVAASNLGTSYGWVDFIIYATSTVIQNPGTIYHIVLDAPDGPFTDAANYVEWGADSSSPSFTGAMSVYASGTWQNIAPGTDACFEVYGQVDDYQESMEEGSFSRVTGDWAYQYGDASDGANTATVTRFKSTRSTPTLPIYEIEIS